jgi:hypothetical protein
MKTSATYAVNHINLFTGLCAIIAGLLEPLNVQLQLTVVTIRVFGYDCPD